MKKILVVVAIVTVALFSSCTREFEHMKNNYTYINPIKAGGTFTIYQNGMKFEHLKCIYWSTEDDDACFVNEAGKKIFVNGSSVIIQE